MIKIDNENGTVLLVNKPLKWTSFDVVNFVRGIIKVKVGHAGTLDPLASVLLILCTGKMTKQIDNYQAQEKEYTGIITLGATTPSFDLETEIDAHFSIDNLNETIIKAAAAELTGVLQQMPPAHSAKRIGGERAYLKARRGEQVEVKPREVSIRKFEITGLEFLEKSVHVSFLVVCSKGTYIRSLARDLGEKLNNGGHLTQLIRTRIGDFQLKDAVSIEELRAQFPKSSI